MKSVNPHNIVEHLISLGYTAAAGERTDKATGEVTQCVYINGLGQISAFLDLSNDPEKFGLKVFGNLKEGYAPALIGEDGKAIRERVTENGKTKWETKRGTPLDAEALRKKNIEIAIEARREITPAVMMAYLLEAEGGDLALMKKAFRLEKYKPAGREATNEVEADATASGTAPIAPKAGQSAGFKQSL